LVAKADVGRLGRRLGAGGREIVCECGAAASSGRGAGRWVILGGLSAAARRCRSRRLCSDWESTARSSGLDRGVRAGSAVLSGAKELGGGGGAGTRGGATRPKAGCAAACLVLVSRQYVGGLCRGWYVSQSVVSR
jgi:hypothetical protein